MMDVTIYARYSSERQDEASIEGQLKVCREFIKRNGWTEIGEPYIDRAKTGTNAEKRDNFQKMVADSKKGIFQAIVVYKFDRFARSRKDSLIYKEILRKNAVKVISANETVSDDPSGMLIEGFHELMAEWFSINLSVNVKRGMDLNADKCLTTGGNCALGFKVNTDRTFAKCEDTAPVVQTIFEMYAEGKTMAEISRFMNARGIKTSQGNFFNKNSLQNLLKNKRYIGVYTYKGTETPNGMPRIISDDLFNRVQEKMKTNKKNFGGTRAKNNEFHMTTKLFCDECGALMVGVSGTSRLGIKYYYYSCNGARQKKCDKKQFHQSKIEDSIIKMACVILRDKKNINLIADRIVEAYNEDVDTKTLATLEKKLTENEKAFKSLLLVIEKGGDFSDEIQKRMYKLKEEKELLKQEIAVEQRKLQMSNSVDEAEILFFLTELSEMILRKETLDEFDRKAIFSLLINRADVFNDGRIRLFCNVGENPYMIEGEAYEKALKKEKPLSDDGEDGSSGAVCSSDGSSEIVLAGVAGFEPTQCQSQSLMPYRLATPLYFT